jgi:hypothetical protein
MRTKIVAAIAVLHAVPCATGTNVSPQLTEHVAESALALNEVDTGS